MGYSIKDVREMMESLEEKTGLDLELYSHNTPTHNSIMDHGRVIGPEALSTREMYYALQFANELLRHIERKKEVQA